MKTVYLLRHAKSAWSSPELDDFDRPLAKRGVAAARLIGTVMREGNLVPALVFCSAARRAVETWDLVAPSLEAEVPVKYLRSLYLAAPSNLFGLVYRVPNSLASVLLLGHNPGLGNFAAALAGPGSQVEDHRRLLQKYPTAALTVIEFDVEHWHEVAPGLGRLVSFLRPRDVA